MEGMTTTTAFAIRALPADVLGTVRAGGTDASGLPGEQVEATGGEPLRCCLRDADPGDLDPHRRMADERDPIAHVGAVPVSVARWGWRRLWTTKVARPAGSGIQ